MSRVVVIGGGATGLGILWDLALRGVPATLVEQGDLGHGTSGRSHGLLHSGARYAVTDPDVARQCAVESAIVRRIAPGATEACGGVFVRLAGEDPGYGSTWRRACAAAGIAVRPADPRVLLAAEPALTRRVVEAYEVPDAALDATALLAALARGAAERGAHLLPHHRVVGAEVSGGAVRGLVLDGREGRLPADVVLNAAGPWAGRVAGLFGVDLPVALSRGSHLVLTERLTTRVINRLRPPGDVDLLVPRGGRTVVGTTAVDTDEPDAHAVSAEEAERLLRHGASLVPGLVPDHTYSGVRCLLGQSGRAATRDFAVIDHAARDGLTGLISVVGGKLTTYRRMAAAAADLVVGGTCRTADTPLPRLTR